MYDPTFHPNNLRQELTYSDHLRDRTLYDDRIRESVIADAGNRVLSGYGGTPITGRNLNGSRVYKLNSLSDELVLRKLGRNIKRVTRVKQTNRSYIIKCLQSLLAEGVPYRVYKIDIHKFYESIDPSVFLDPITSDAAFPPSTIRMLSSFFEHTQSNNIKGLPRGLALSSVISEYVMREFDSTVTKFPCVFYYSRFVDDMIFITKGDECPKKFLRNINKALPQGLSTHPYKTKCWLFSAHHKSHKSEHVEGSFDFLGYKFQISKSFRNNNKKAERTLLLDISDKKVKRLKTRLCISFRQYLSDGIFEDLENRIRLLCGNYHIYDHNRRLRKVGISHSYHLIKVDTSTALDDLDLFYKKMILSSSGKICRPLSVKLSQIEKRALLRYSFKRGFEKKYIFPLTAVKYLD